MEINEIKSKDYKKVTTRRYKNSIVVIICTVTYLFIVVQAIYSIVESYISYKCLREHEHIAVRLEKVSQKYHEFEDEDGDSHHYYTAKYEGEYKGMTYKLTNRYYRVPDVSVRVAVLPTNLKHWHRFYTKDMLVSQVFVAVVYLIGGVAIVFAEYVILTILVRVGKNACSSRR